MTPLICYGFVNISCFQTLPQLVFSNLCSTNLGKVTKMTKMMKITKMAKNGGNFGLNHRIHRPV